MIINSPISQPHSPKAAKQNANQPSLVLQRGSQKGKFAAENMNYAFYML
jgi:hypothetical protein